MIQQTTLTKTNITYLVKFLILLTVATGAPLIGIHSQWITGPIVNATLILSVFLIGTRGALLIGMLPSTIALGTGLLPAVLAPMVPFIIIGNSILVLFFSQCHPERGVNIFSERKNINEESKDPVTLAPSQFLSNYWVALFFGSGLKFLFLFLTSGIVINLLLNQAVATKVAAMMSWPQFFTAVIGGIIAYGVVKILKK